MRATGLHTVCVLHLPFILSSFGPNTTWPTERGPGLEGFNKESLGVARHWRDITRLLGLAASFVDSCQFLPNR